MSDPIARPLGIEAQPGCPEMRSAKRPNQPMTGTMPARWPMPPISITISANPAIAPAAPRSSSEKPPAGGDFGGSAAASSERPACRELMGATLPWCRQLMSHSLMFTFGARFQTRSWPVRAIVKPTCLGRCTSTEPFAARGLQEAERRADVAHDVEQR